jgi:hypothetical protein
MSDPTYKILCLSGGGAAGYATTRYIQTLERAFGRQAFEMFDFVCGVSTGSIITAGLIDGMWAHEIGELYRENLPNIFSRPKWKFWRGWVGSSKYSPDALQKMLQLHFPKSWRRGNYLSDAMIHATQIGPAIRPRHWKCFQDQDPVPQPATWEVVMASCAAPTYFPPVTIGSEVYVDGGLTANNPAMMAVTEALRKGVEPKNIRVLSVTPMGTVRRVSKPAKRKSAMAWVEIIPEVFMCADELSVDYECRQALGLHYLPVNLGVSTAMDDCSKAAIGDMAIAGDGAAAATIPLVEKLILE